MASQIQAEWDTHEKTLIQCAQAAWGKDGAGYDLCSWEAHSLTAIVAFGQSARANQEYQHVFLFERRGNEYHLRTIGKAPWDRSIGWWGVCLTAKSTFYKCFPVGRHTAERPELPAFQEYTGA